MLNASGSATGSATPLSLLPQLPLVLSVPLPPSAPSSDRQVLTSSSPPRPLQSSPLSRVEFSAVANADVVDNSPRDAVLGPAVPHATAAVEVPPIAASAVAAGGVPTTGPVPGGPGKPPSLRFGRQRVLSGGSSGKPELSSLLDSSSDSVFDNGDGSSGADDAVPRHDISSSFPIGVTADGLFMTPSLPGLNIDGLTGFVPAAKGSPPPPTPNRSGSPFQVIPVSSRLLSRVNSGISRLHHAGSAHVSRGE